MNQLAESNETIAFPALPDVFIEKFPAAPKSLKFRRFGTEEGDLAIDFSPVGESPALVTQILRQCTVSADENLPPDFFQEMSVGKRLECLLRLAAGNEQREFSFPFKCGACGSELELNLTLDEIAEQQREADLNEQIEIEIAGQKLIFRRPCGSDQENWHRLTFPDESTAVKEMLGSLQIVPPAPPQDLSDEVFSSIDAAMDEADPLVNFSCTVSCFECRAANLFEMDLYRFALGELRRRQWRLLYAVHRLASHYHWSEREIFAVPDWRRRQYLDLISDGKSR